MVAMYVIIDNQRLPDITWIINSVVDMKII